MKDRFKEECRNEAGKQKIKGENTRWFVSFFYGEGREETFFLIIYRIIFKCGTDQ